ncbi:hypothetical protein [Paraclostridium sp. AKS81]|uniref:hypothetical protein n=1 Tax=Paraclostridium sp. AKS81 TaxID=2876117 RepID=UPI0021E0F005|nr:hypothetical protein [Paraclostridium sp. AKS81]MCU9811728.1 hypothetical protein [Paraclostridium sp. AKS81]
MDFFFKSINTKLSYNYYIDSSDKLSFIENETEKVHLEKKIEKLCERYKRAWLNTSFFYA